MTYLPFQMGDTKSVPFNRREITSREIFLQCGSGFSRTQDLRGIQEWTNEQKRSASLKLVWK